MWLVVSHQRPDLMDDRKRLDMVAKDRYLSLFRSTDQTIPIIPVSPTKLSSVNDVPAVFLRLGHNFVSIDLSVLFSHPSLPLLEYSNSIPTDSALQCSGNPIHIDTDLVIGTGYNYDQELRVKILNMRADPIGGVDQIPFLPPDFFLLYFSLLSFLSFLSFLFFLSFFSFY